MNTEPVEPAQPEAPAMAAEEMPAKRQAALSLVQGLAIVGVLALIGIAGGAITWQRVTGMQEQLARQSAESGVLAQEARAQALQARDLAMETAAKLAVTEARLAEVTLQRTQLEELMQSLSRSRDENLVVDIESAIRLAQQQAQLTGSVEPLLAALKSAELRIGRAAQPRLTPLQRAIARDIGRVRGSTVADTSALLVKLDELALLADDLPVANAVRVAKPGETMQRKADEPLPTWWARLGAQVMQELRSLVRVSRINEPEAALLSPEQSFFLRENLKLKLLNARLGLLSRQVEASRADLVQASTAINRYFDPASRKTQNAQQLLQQVQLQMKSLELPRVDDTLAALSTAAAGR